jgi:hypothetical protein
MFIARSPETTAKSSISAAVGVRAMLALSPGTISLKGWFSIVAPFGAESISMNIIQ